jgi:hypothetical protein
VAEHLSFTSLTTYSNFEKSWWTQRQVSMLELKNLSDTCAHVDSATNDTFKHFKQGERSPITAVKGNSVWATNPLLRHRQDIEQVNPSTRHHHPYWCSPAFRLVCPPHSIWCPTSDKSPPANLYFHSLQYLLTFYRIDSRLMLPGETGQYLPP